MQDIFDLQRFVVAQAPVYDTALSELRAGRKRSHWMWFIFPQVAGLGMSAMSRRYAVSGIDEAAAYLAHPTLGPRLPSAARTYSTSRDAQHRRSLVIRTTRSSARR